MDLPLPKSLSEMIAENGQAPGITRIIRDLIESDLGSEEKQKAFEGIAYYNGDHQIRYKKRYYYDKHKKRQEDTIKENARPVNNFHADFVDEKVFYVLGQHPGFTSVSEQLAGDLDKALDLSFYETLQNAVEGASNKGSEFIYVYVENNAFKYTVMPFEELIIIRDQSIAKNITDVVRYYLVEVITEGDKKLRYRVEWYKPEAVTYFMEQADGKFELDENEPVNPKPYLTRVREVERVNIPVDSAAWGAPARLPFIEVANNRRRQTDLERIKSLQDLYNVIEAGFFDNIADMQELVTVVKDAVGSDPAEVLENLRHYKLVLAEEGGGIEAVKAEIPVEARETALKRLYRDIHHFGKAVLFEPDKYASAPSGVALKFLYSRLDMKADDVILSLRAALNAFVEFFVIFQKWAKGVDYGENAFVEWTFNKSQIFNEAEQVESCQKSKGIVSDETILAHHPFVSDVQEELKRVETDQDLKLNLEN